MPGLLGVPDDITAVHRCLLDCRASATSGKRLLALIIDKTVSSWSNREWESKDSRLQRSGGEEARKSVKNLMAGTPAAISKQVFWVFWGSDHDDPRIHK